MAYDADWVRSHYEGAGDDEWSRLTGSPSARIKLAVHNHYLHEQIAPGDRVLEIGAGAGRFTMELAAIGARIIVADLSPDQLRLNRQHAAEEGFAEAVEAWVECDVCNLRAHFANGEFDAVVCYGGPLSYVFDHAGQAASELARVTRKQGVVLASVMGLWGSAHGGLPEVLAIDRGLNRAIVRSGDLKPGGPIQHYCHMFRAHELRLLLEGAGLVVEALSASNCLCTGWDDELADFAEDSPEWQHLLELEIEACREPGCVDMGTHLIAACRKPWPTGAFPSEYPRRRPRST
jgi:SAM-dependent methyltransferase